MRKTTDTVLFDLDGTLVDTTEYIVGAFMHVLKTHRTQTPRREDILNMLGHPLLECYMTLAHIDLEEAKLFTEAHEAFQRENRHLVRLFQNTLSTLETLQNHGYHMGICTTRGRKSVETTLADTHIAKYFDVVICAQDTAKNKPDPEPLLLALNTMKRNTATTIMIGDSYVDIAAGKNARVKTARALYGFNQEKLHEPEPDAFILDIQDILTLELS